MPSAKSKNANSQRTLTHFSCDSYSSQSSARYFNLLRKHIASYIYDCIGHDAGKVHFALTCTHPIDSSIEFTCPPHNTKWGADVHECIRNASALGIGSTSFALSKIIEWEKYNNKFVALQTVIAPECMCKSALGGAYVPATSSNDPRRWYLRPELEGRGPSDGIIAMQLSETLSHITTKDIPGHKTIISLNDALCDSCPNKSDISLSEDEKIYRDNYVNDVIRSANATATEISHSLFRTSRITYEASLQGIIYILQRIGSDISSEHLELLYGGIAWQLLLREACNTHRRTQISPASDTQHNHMVSMAIKPSDIFGINLGIDIVLSEFPKQETINDLSDSLLNISQNLDDALVTGDCSLLTQALSEERALAIARSHEPEEVSKRLSIESTNIESCVIDIDNSAPSAAPVSDHIQRTCNSILEYLRSEHFQDTGHDSALLAAASKQGDGGMARQLRINIARLLETAVSLSNREDEWRPISFGICISNPFLCSLLPGAHPLPLSLPHTEAVSHAETDLWYDLDDVVNGLFLTQGPEQRCIFIMPSDPIANLSSAANAPMFAMDMTNYGKRAANDRSLKHWDYASSIYANLTRTCPYAIASVSGPGSRAVVYAYGKKIAYWDSRSWHVRMSSKNLIDEMHSKTSGVCGDINKTPFHELCEIATFMSPYLCPSGHGGLLAWAKHNRIFSNSMTPKGHRPSPSSSVYSLLRTGLPQRIDGNEWLTDRPAVQKLHNSSGVYQLNPPVVKQVIRAASADGAVCLYGREAKVAAVAAKFQADGRVHAKSRMIKWGSRSSAAFAYAQSHRDNRFSISVSSSGPITIYAGGAREGVHLFNKC